MKQAIRLIEGSGGRIFFCGQTIAELWNVSTRPLDKNGFGLSLLDTAEHVRYIEKHFEFLPENRAVYTRWRLLIEQYQVRGAQVHDARLVALMQAHGISSIVTLNGKDFKRFNGITVVHPAEL